MNDPIVFFAAYVAVFVAVAIGIAVVLITGALAVAAMLPHGHPQVYRLREFAGTAPRKALRWAVSLDKIFLIGLVLLFTYLTFMYS